MSMASAEGTPLSRNASQRVIRLSKARGASSLILLPQPPLIRVCRGPERPDPDAGAVLAHRPPGQIPSRRHGKCSSCEPASRFAIPTMKMPGPRNFCEAKLLRKFSARRLTKIAVAGSFWVVRSSFPTAGPRFLRLGNTFRQLERLCVLIPGDPMRKVRQVAEGISNRLTTISPCR